MAAQSPEVTLKEFGSKYFADSQTPSPIKNSGKWLLVLDQTESQASVTFAKYRSNFIDCTIPMQPDELRKSLLGAARYGKTCAFNIGALDASKIADLFDEMSPGVFDQVLDRNKFFETRFYEHLIRDRDAPEYQVGKWSADPDLFSIAVFTSSQAAADQLKDKMSMITIVEK